jgi:hypothetical protein
MVWFGCFMLVKPLCGVFVGVLLAIVCVYGILEYFCTNKSLFFSFHPFQLVFWRAWFD